MSQNCENSSSKDTTEEVVLRKHPKVPKRRIPQKRISLPDAGSLSPKSKSEKKEDKTQEEPTNVRRRSFYFFFFVDCVTKTNLFFFI